MDLIQNEIGLGAHPALIVVDMIRGFTDPECPLGCECPEVVVANQHLLDTFRKLKLPIFFTTVVYHDKQQAKVFRHKINALNVLTPDSKWVELDPAMHRLPSEVLVEKQWASAFHKTDLDEQLRADNIDSLVVTGLTTSGCVRATAVDGLQYDYRVVVASDAVGDRNPEAHAANLFDLKAKYTDVNTSAEIIDQLNDDRRQDHDSTN